MPNDYDLTTAVVHLHIEQQEEMDGWMVILIDIDINIDRYIYEYAYAYVQVRPCMIQTHKSHKGALFASYVHDVFIRTVFSSAKLHTE